MKKYLKFITILGYDGYFSIFCAAFICISLSISIPKFTAWIFSAFIIGVFEFWEYTFKYILLKEERKYKKTICGIVGSCIGILIVYLYYNTFNVNINWF